MMNEENQSKENKVPLDQEDSKVKVKDSKLFPKGEMKDVVENVEQSYVKNEENGQEDEGNPRLEDENDLKVTGRALPSSLEVEDKMEKSSEDMKDGIKKETQEDHGKDDHPKKEEDVRPGKHISKDDEEKKLVDVIMKIKDENHTPGIQDEDESFGDENVFTEKNLTENPCEDEKLEEALMSSDDDDPDYTPDLVTEAMIEEESKLHDENIRKQQEEEKGILIQASEEDKFERLTLLLQKSKIYADFLLKVVVEKKEKEKRRAIKKEKLQKKKMEKRAMEELKDAETREEEVGMKRKASSGLRDGEAPAKKVRRESRKRKDSKKEVELKVGSKSGSVEELLKSKLYLSSPEEATSLITEVDGIRYFGDQVVNPIQPTLFTGGILRDYQVVGYQWLKVLFENAVNGILADEMGLGKTIQCIALICQFVKVGFKGPFLVCAPMSTIPNWISEFRTFAPAIPVMLYHGSAEERGILARHITDVGKVVPCHPVVVTSYEILMRDRPILGRHTWEYLMIDEGHRIKNTNCRLVKELKLLKVNAKLLLTGTPLQNNLGELWALLNFIIPEVFDDLQVFEAWFNLSDVKSRGAAQLSLEQEQTFLSTLYEILTPFVLRRIKADVVLDLPPKSEVIVYAPFSPKQEHFYRAAVNKTIRNMLKGKNENKLLEPCKDLTNALYGTRSSTLEKRIADDRVERDSFYDNADINVSLNNVMMLLRKCCNHPYLIEYPLIPGTDIFKIDNGLVLASGKLMLMDRMLPKLHSRGHKVLIFSQMTKMLDILEDYCYLRQYTFVRLDGSTRVDDRQARIKRFNTEQDIFIFLLSTKAGGLGINLTSADTVIIYDSDWNPQNDLQAQDRCHRIGQKKPVMIYRLVTASSVDQEMVERAAEKRRLEKMVMHEEKFKGHLEVELKQKTRIGKTEIMKMLKSDDFDQVVDNTERVMTDDDLEKLLDRTHLMKKREENLEKSTLFRVLEQENVRE